MPRRQHALLLGHLREAPAPASEFEPDTSHCVAHGTRNLQSGGTGLLHGAEQHPDRVQQRRQQELPLPAHDGGERLLCLARGSIDLRRLPKGRRLRRTGTAGRYGVRADLGGCLLGCEPDWHGVLRAMPLLIQVSRPAACHHHLTS